MTEKEKEKMHAVHIYAVVRVKVLIDPKDVSDDKPETLIKAAEARVSFNELFQREGREGRDVFEYTEWGEEISHYCIDKANDPNFDESRYFLPNTRDGDEVYLMPSANARRVAIVVKDGRVQFVLSSHKDVQHVILDHDEANEMRKVSPPPFRAPEFSDTAYVPDIDAVRDEFDKEYHS